MLGIIAAVAILAMVLQGCGGDDNGVDPSQQTRIDELEDEVEGLEADLMDAEQDTGKADLEADIAGNVRAKSLRAAIEAHDLVDADTAVVMPTEVTMANTTVTHAAADGFMAEVDSDEFEEYNEDMESPPPALMDTNGVALNSVTLKRRLVLPEEGSPNVDELIYLYSDINMDTPMAFDRHYDLNEDDQLTVGADTSASKVMFDEGYGDDGEIPVSDDPGVAGSFDEVDGTYTCTAGCTVSVNDDGTIDVSGGATLTFKPDDATDEVMVPDSDYLVLGWWLAKPDKASGAHMFETFAWGSDMFDAADKIGGTGATRLEGRARYAGPAAGKYVMTDDKTDISTLGIFTATAQLLADFDDPTAGETPDPTDDNDGTIQGHVVDFMEGEESFDWTVRLAPVNLTADMNDFQGTTSIGTGDDAITGEWEGMFYGNDRSDGEPGSVAGRFSVDGANLDISGAFGAQNTGADE
jgi:hypothetical protein